MNSYVMGAITRRRSGGAIESFQNGDWNDGSTWVGGNVPQAGENVIILHNVTIPSGLTIEAIKDLTISANTLTQSNILTQTITGDLLVESGANITHTIHASGDGSNLVYAVNFAANNISIVGTITAIGKGHAGGYDSGNGYGPSPGDGFWGGGAGGAHCGNGGNGAYSGTGGTGYCTVSPSTMGSGGGAPNNNRYGGWGGGLIKLVATGIIDITGTISTTGGTPGVTGGGGGGGTINLTANIVSGTPTLMSAKGGLCGDWAGSGGGGLIYINYTTSNSINSGMVDVSAGAGGTGYNAGSAGTFTAE